MSNYPKRIWIGSAAWFDRPYGGQQGYVREDLATAQHCILEVDRQARRIKSLLRENQALKKERDDWAEMYAINQKAAAITPEMRETIRSFLDDTAPPKQIDYVATALSARVILHDLLGEQG